VAGPRDNRYVIDLAGVAIGLECRQPALAEGLARWFGTPSAPVEPTILLDLEMVPHEDTPVLPNSLLTTKTVGAGGEFDIADGLIRGYYDQVARRGELKAKGVLLEGRLMRIFEQVLYQAHVSARQAAGLPGFLVHSAGVVADHRGFLFVGPSEAGKTTAALNSMAWHVLGDEMILVIPGGNGPEIVGTSFNGTFRDKHPGRAPLAGVFLLEQAPRHALLPVGQAEATATIAGEIVPPVGLDELPGARTLAAMTDLAAQLVDRVEVARLELLPDPGFWRIIAERFSLATPAGAGPAKGT
jgi:hypothetical protein